MGRPSGRSGSVGPSRHVLSCGDSYQSHPRPTCASGPVVKDAWFVTASHPPLSTFLICRGPTATGVLSALLTTCSGRYVVTCPRVTRDRNSPPFALPHIASDSRPKTYVQLANLRHGRRSNEVSLSRAEPFAIGFLRGPTREWLRW